MGRFDTRQQADEFVDALPTRTRNALGAGLSKRVAQAKLDPGSAFTKELRKRLRIDHGDERVICWALVRRGLVELQSPPLWMALAGGLSAHPSNATPEDVIRLLQGITDPWDTRGGLIRCFPEWSCALDEICFVVCGADFGSLKSFWQSTTGTLRTGLASVLVRGGVLGKDELDDDWATLLATFYRTEKSFGTSSGMQLFWPAHPSSQAESWAPPHARRVLLWDEASKNWSKAFDDLLEAFTTRDAYAARLASVEPETKRKPKRPKNVPPASVAVVPSYSNVVWLFGRRIRMSAPIGDCGQAAQDIADGARDRRFMSEGLYGAISLPIGGNAEVCLGAILNGSPIVREQPEMRENVLSSVHSAVSMRFELLSSGDAAWRNELAEIIDEVVRSGHCDGEAVSAADQLERDFTVSDDDVNDGLAWHLVARTPGPGGSIYWGTLLPNAGDVYQDDVIETVMCLDGDGSVVARLVGARVCTVSDDRPVVTLRGSLEREAWQDDIRRRIATLTYKSRPCGAWLVSRVV